MALEKAEILVPIDDRKKNRTLAFSAYLEILQQDTLPLPR